VHKKKTKSASDDKNAKPLYREKQPENDQQDSSKRSCPDNREEEKRRVVQKKKKKLRQKATGTARRIGRNAKNNNGGEKGKRSNVKSLHGR